MVVNSLFCLIQRVFRSGADHPISILNSSELAGRPQARIVIVGGDEVSYGRQPPAGTTYRQLYLKELDGQLDLSRIHFVGKVPYPVFLGILQVSSVHVYLT